MEKKYTRAQLFKRTLQDARLFWPHIILLFFLNLISTPIALLKPLPLKIIIDNGFGSHPLPGLINRFFPAGYQAEFLVIVLIAVALVILTFLIEYLNVVAIWLLQTYTGEKIVLRIRTILFNHVQRLSLGFHDSRGIAHSLYRLQWDTMNTRSLLIDNLSPLLSSVITLFAMIAVMFSINWRFALIALSIMPPLYFLIQTSANRLRKEWDYVKDSESKAMAVMEETLGALRVVKAFGQENFEQNRFVARSDKAVKGQMKLARTGALYDFLIGMVIAAGTAYFIYLGAVQVKSGLISLGDLTLIMAYLAQFFSPLQSINKTVNNLQSSVSGVERVYSLLDNEREVHESTDAVHLKKARGQIEFREVSFGYHPGKPVLKKVSFRINAGDRVGIMGSTGAGKSTLISLLMRFYDATEGTIEIDGEDIRKFKLADYRDQFSLVLQEPVLFSASVGENIGYGKPGAGEKEISEAAKAANAHDFIIKSSDGYNTEVGERGMQLSGGERQRISLARAFVKNAPILILDEPTSSVDIKTEGLIMEAMERLMAGRTTFLITHRLDTLSSCNVILHLEEGHLVDVLRNFDTQALLRKKINFVNPAAQSVQSPQE